MHRHFPGCRSAGGKVGSSLNFHSQVPSVFFTGVPILNLFHYAFPTDTLTTTSLLLSSFSRHSLALQDSPSTESIAVIEAHSSLVAATTSAIIFPPSFASLPSVLSHRAARSAASLYYNDKALCRVTVVYKTQSRSYAKSRAKMPPKKQVVEEKIPLGRPGNNLKSGIVSSLCMSMQAFPATLLTLVLRLASPMSANPLCSRPSPSALSVTQLYEAPCRSSNSQKNRPVLEGADSFKELPLRHH
jgi:hypothetical protein